jgi:hypothetical protein
MSVPLSGVTIQPVRSDRRLSQTDTQNDGRINFDIVTLTDSVDSVFRSSVFAESLTERIQVSAFHYNLAIPNITVTLVATSDEITILTQINYDTVTLLSGLDPDSLRIMQGDLTSIMADNSAVQSALDSNVNHWNDATVTDAHVSTARTVVFPGKQKASSTSEVAPDEVDSGAVAVTVIALLFGMVAFVVVLFLGIFVFGQMFRLWDSCESIFPCSYLLPRIRGDTKSKYDMVVPSNQKPRPPSSVAPGVRKKDPINGDAQSGDAGNLSKHSKADAGEATVEGITESEAAPTQAWTKNSGVTAGEPKIQDITDMEEVPTLGP